MSSEAYERGVKRRREIIGTGADSTFEMLAELAPNIDRLQTEYFFGDIWNRPQLDERGRRIVAITCFAVKGKDRQLKGHIQGALRSGMTREELVEIFTTLSFLAGADVAVDAIRVAREVFDEVDGHTG